MSILSQLNFVAIAVSAVAYFALGAIYFNPKVMGTKWMEGHKLSAPTEEDKKGMGKMMGITFVYGLISCIGIGCLIQIIQPATILLGVKIGLLGAVFSSVSLAMSYMYTKKSFQLVVLDSGYHILGLVIASVIQTAWL
ncbi:hypothetical protein WSM22_08500 [Cytophagales bacterium WSM2-2]|nr:hypothetical protein WSM22_08500 [Cytophagales bacterium WSM2-2]